MIKKMIKKRGVGKILVTALLTIGLILSNTSPALAAGTGNGYVKCAGSHGGSTYVYSDSAFTVKLPKTDVIQFIYAGADQVPNAPDVNGNPTGDDSLIQSGTVGTPWNTDGEFFYYLQNMTDYAYIYVRAWNAASIGSATKYGDSAVYQVNGGTPVPSPFTWNVPNFYATQHDKPTATLTITSPNGGEYWAGGSTHNITWTSSGYSGNVKIEYSTTGVAGVYTEINGGTYSKTNDGTESWILPTGVNSSNCFVRVSADPGGTPYDTSNAAFAIDSTDPSAPTGVTATPSGWTATNSFSINWINPADPGIAGYYYKVGSAPTSDTDGTYTTSKPIPNVTAPSSGQYTVYVWLVDTAGNINYQNNGSTTISYDGIAPTLSGSITSPTSPTSNPNLVFSWPTATDTLSGLSTSFAYYYLLDHNATATGATVKASGTGTNATSATINGVAEGTWYLHVVAQDAAGNLSVVLNTSTSIVVDTSAPSVSATNPSNGATGVSKTLTSITVTFNDNMDPTSVQTTSNYTVSGAASGSHTVSNAVYNDGAKTVTLTVSGTFSDSEIVSCSVLTGVKDKAGNNLASAYLWSFTIAAPGGPSITRLELTSNPGVAITSANISDGISIIGTGFGAAQGTSTIAINGVPVTTIYFWSATKIDLQVPSGATTGNLVLTVNGSPVSTPLTINANITTTSLPSGNVGVAYSQTLQAVGGTGSYSWSLLSGSLPAGLTLSSAGVISGTPTATGTANFTVRVTSGASTDDQALAIIVNASTDPYITRLEMTSAPGVAITSAQVGDGISIVGGNLGAIQGTSTITVGGIPVTAIYYWSATKVDFAVPTGAVSGDVVITVNSKTASSPLTIIPSGLTLDITTTSLPNGTVGTAYSQTLSATGGNGTYSWSLLSGTLPAGLSMSAAGVISGMPTAAGTSAFTVQVSDGATTDAQALSITINSIGPVGPSITSITPSSGHYGQTIVVAGSNFGAFDANTSVLRFGTTKAYPTSWTASQIIASVPTGIPTGEIDVYVVNSAGSDSEKFTVLGSDSDGKTSIYIDDYEGGCVGNWTIDNDNDGVPDSGYYAFGSGVTPTNTNITADLRQADASYAGSLGAKVRYSYDATGPGYGGWGGKLAQLRDLTKAENVEMYVRWDGSNNDIKFTMLDQDGTCVAAIVSNAMLKSLLGGYGKVNVARSSFVLDPTGAASGEDGSFDWSKVANYNMVYTGTNTVTSYQNIDNIIATYGGGSVTSEVVITQVTPASGPAGSKFTALGLNFGPSQGQSSLYFQNEQAGTWILADIITWGNQQINAIVPEKAAKGGYKLQVIKVAIVAGGISALESNKADFTITAPSPANGVVIAYPNPFNPISAITSEATTTFAFNPNGAVNMYVGLYDMTARLVKKIDATASGVTWDGRDENGKLVGDGAYLIRVVDKDSNRLIAKGKVLVIKH